MKYKKILFVSYDGLFDQLGQSQILPYLKLLKNNHTIYVLTFEKKKNLQDKQSIQNILKDFNWRYMYFSESKFKLMKLYDYLKMFLSTIYIIRKNKISICHGRGFVPSLIIYLINIIFKVKYIYDMRGFWLDERIDNNQINLSKNVDFLIYKILKKIDKKIIISAKHIVVLTKKARNIICKYNNNVTIIPCATDFSEFNPDRFLKNADIFYNNLGIDNNTKIFSYLGSVKGAYMLNAMLRYFKLLKVKYPKSIFLIITRDIEYTNLILSNKKFNKIKSMVYIKSLERNEIPNYLSISFAMIVFVKNSYARLAMSPTKISEGLALNVPIIINSNIGDIDNQIDEFKAGITVDIFDIRSIKKSIFRIQFLNSNRNNLRIKAHKTYDLKFAVIKYSQIYSLM